MSEAQTDSEKRRRLPWAIAHGAANNIFSQLTFFGPVFLLFLNELGLPKARIGFLLSLLPFCCILAVFVAPAVARAGVKRVYVTFWALRKGITAFLLLTPWVLDRFGTEGAFLFVSLVVGGFAICRAIGETAYLPWFQEVVPNAIRGKYTAVDNLVGMLGGILALAGASYGVGHYSGLNRFVFLIGVGVIFGGICVGCLLPLPGGGPGKRAEIAHLRALQSVWKDRNFRLFLCALGLFNLTTLLFSFLPLFMKEQVGIRDDQIVLLQVGSYAGSFLASYLWGGMADRRGGRPVMAVCVCLTAALPVLWMGLPRHSVWSFTCAVGIAFLSGVASVGWVVGKFRLLYVRVVPPERKTEYMAVYYAWVGLVGGIGPFAAGWTVDHFQGLKGGLGPFHLDAYSPLFLAGLLFLLGALVVLTRLRE